MYQSQSSWTHKSQLGPTCSNPTRLGPTNAYLDTHMPTGKHDRPTCNNPSHIKPTYICQLGSKSNNHSHRGLTEAIWAYMYQSKLSFTHICQLGPTCSNIPHLAFHWCLYICQLGHTYAFLDPHMPTHLGPTNAYLDTQMPTRKHDWRHLTNLVTLNPNMQIGT